MAEDDCALLSKELEESQRVSKAYERANEDLKWRL
jgi:hypothetical protein